jgi:3-hydroxyisobutyrate dehydrogenase-like beta-hydroxyacid dehydrogenase
MPEAPKDIPTTRFSGSKAMKLGWLGAGQMGFRMAGNLLAAGHEISVFDPKPDNVELLALRGAVAAGSIAEVCADAEVIFSSIPDDMALRRVALAAGGVLPSLARGCIYVDMSTVSPGVSAEVGLAARQKDIGYIRAPVSGSVGFAEAGTLTVIVSGPTDAFDICKPLFEILGSKCFHVGEDEQARYLKLAINNMVHATAVAMAETLAVGRKGGLDWEQMLDVIAASAVASPLVQYKAAAMKCRDFTPASFVATAVKDQELFVDAAKDVGVKLDIGKEIAGVFRDMLSSPDKEKDFFATVLRAERAAGLGEI